MDENVALSAIAAHGGTHQSAVVGDVQTAQVLGAPAGVVHTGYPQAYGELPQARIATTLLLCIHSVDTPTIR